MKARWLWYAALALGALALAAFLLWRFGILAGAGGLGAAFLAWLLPQPRKPSQPVPVHGFGELVAIVSRKTVLLTVTSLPLL